MTCNSTKLIRDCLIRKARARETLTYTELQKECGLSTDFSIPNIRAILTNRLKSIFSHELEKGRPILTILVKEKGSIMPSPKFFVFTKELKIQSENLDDSTFYEDGVKNVFDTWSNDIFYNQFKYDF
jgi:hypothetical protein